MIDTDICVELIRKKSISLLRRIEMHKPEKLFLSSITVSELEYGASKSLKPELNRMALTQFVSPFSIISYDAACAAKYGEIRAALEKKGKVIGAMDLLIAAHAITAGCILVTANTREFERIDELKLVNWLRQ
jgi:tRNA(fMet)-specific endonuclease VapC